MSDTRRPQDETPAPTAAFAAIVAAAAVAVVMVMIGSVGNLGSVQADAGPAVLPAPGQFVSPEEHAAFIREGHNRAALEGDESPLPPTF